MNISNNREWFRTAIQAAIKLRLLPKPLEPKPGMPERFLIVQLDGNLGDTVLLLPTIELLRKYFPQARIECAVESRAAPILRQVPAVDLIYALPLGMGRLSTFRLRLRWLLKIVYFYARYMRHAQPTTTIVPRWGDDVFLTKRLAFLTQAPRRIGFYEPRVNPAAGHPLLTETVLAGTGGVSEAAKGVLLLQSAGLIPPQDLNRLVKERNKTLESIAASVHWPTLAARLHLRADQRFIIVAPSASAPQRRWPLPRWVAVLEGLEPTGLSPVILAGAQDAEVARELHRLCRQAGVRATLVAGQTSLTEAIALISHAELFLGNDSGPAHVAGAVGLPSVVLFFTSPECDPDHSASPERFGPMGPRVTICRPSVSVAPCQGTCDADVPHCIEGITVPEVLAAAETALHGRPFFASHA